MSAPVPRLITISVSHYCEKARWGLDHARVAFIEDGHAPMFHAPVARRHGKRTSTPLLLIDGRAVQDSTRILQYLDASLPLERALYPRDDTRDEVVALEDELDERFGPHVRRLAYYHLLPHAAQATTVLGVGIPPLERWLLPRIFSLILRPALRRGLAIDAPGAERSQARVQATFDTLSARLADGRRFLVGDRFSAADLTFAALAAPVLWLGPYASMPAPSSFSRELAEVYARLLGSPAGALAQRLYAEHRGASAAA